MKKQIIAMAVSTLLFSQGTFAQIPTTDTASIAQQAMQQMETIAQWKRCLLYTSPSPRDCS